MKLQKLAVASAALAIISAATISSAYATTLFYAANGHGAMGFAIGGATGVAMASTGCGASDCKIVMHAKGDCMAFVEASSAQGYYYWFGYTTAQNAYARQSEIKRVSDMVMGWCTSNKAGGPLCRVRHATCASYITNLN